MLTIQTQNNMKNLLLAIVYLTCFIFETNAQQVTSREGVTIPTLEINLWARAMNGSMFLADGVLQNFNNSFSPSVDNMDVRKFMNYSDNLAIKNGNYNLIVERRPHLCVTDTLQLMLTGTRIAPYRFEIDPSVLKYPNIKAVLIDQFLKKETTVSFTSVTNIHFDITVDPLSRAANRFMMVYRINDPVRFISIAAVRNIDNSIGTVYKTENENNINSYSLERSYDGINFEPVASQTPTANNFGNPYYSFLDSRANASYNWYRVKANLISGEPIYSMIAKAEVAKTTKPSRISVFPNPIINGKINISFDNKPQGLYKLFIVNSYGQTVHTEIVDVQDDFVNKTITKSGMPSGMYRLITENTQGQKITTTLLVQ